MGDGIAVADFDFRAIFASDAEESSDDSLLVRIASEGMVENGKYCLEYGRQ